MLANADHLLICAVPVASAQDDAKPGTGTVSLSADDPCRIIGKVTRFTSEFSPRMTITLPKDIGYASSEVVEVISDTELRVKRELKGEDDVGTAQVLEALEQLRKEGADGFSYKCVPYVSQEDMFRQVYHQLDEGGGIIIFPEGKVFPLLETVVLTYRRWQPRPNRLPALQGRLCAHGPRCHGQ